MNNGKTDRNAFHEIETIDELKKYWTREYEHYDYSHYTKLSILNDIVGNCEFWAYPTTGFNDKSDHYDANKYFSICFSTGSSENISLWYLYSGADGKGGRITFNQNNIKKLVEMSEYKLENETTGEIEVLNKEDYIVSFKDIIYCSFNKDEKNIVSGNSDANKNKKVFMRYNNMTNCKIFKDDFARFYNENYCFIKTNPWYYEKETRLLIELKHRKSKALKKTDTYKIIVDFSNIKRFYFKLKLAPEITTFDEVYKHPNLKLFVEKTSNVYFSDFKGDIEMKLCDKCEIRKKCEKCSKCDETNC